MIHKCLLNLILIFLALSNYYSYAHEVEIFDLRMPKVTPHQDEQYLCTPVRITPRTTFNIVGFIPNATMNVVHHMLLYGCVKPGTYEEVWNCGEMSANGIQNEYETGPVCASGSQIIYAWARDAPRLELPEDVGFLVGSGSDIKYLVLQIHYMHKMSDEPDQSGLYLQYTRQPLTKQAGVFLLGSSGKIMPHTTEHMETSCRITEDKVMHPFAFRTHTHSLGKVVAGYIVRTDEDGEHWIELGKRDPMTPQMFYPTMTQEAIRMGDVLAARCTMVSDRDRITYIGSTNQDEMCNFYLMYWVEGTSTLNQKFCYSAGPPHYFWKNDGFVNIPNLEASTI